jgi:hypothetical protein
MQPLCRLPPTAKSSSAADGKVATWQQPVQPGSTGADPFGHFAVCWQTAKESGLLTGLLTSGSRRQRGGHVCRLLADGKASR